MVNAFTTASFSGTPDKEQTPSTPYADRRSWAKGHLDNLAARVANGDTPTDPLETCWESDGDTHCVLTYRNAGESDADFVDRHSTDILLDAIVELPDFP